ncbi:MAG: hypothetical protein OES09_10780 [Gammaproteobacteria bacterium]|nr:hypothetical protein [Gammaproteobacteria bacterium]
MKILASATALAWLIVTGAVMAGEPVFTDFDGRRWAIEDRLYPEGWTVVMSECPICNEEVGQLIRFHRNHPRGAVILGVALDGLPRAPRRTELHRSPPRQFPQPDYRRGRRGRVLLPVHR